MRQFVRHAVLQCATWVPFKSLRIQCIGYSWWHLRMILFFWHVAWDRCCIVKKQQHPPHPLRDHPRPFPLGVPRLSFSQVLYIESFKHWQLVYWIWILSNLIFNHFGALQCGKQIFTYSIAVFFAHCVINFACSEPWFLCEGSFVLHNFPVWHAL